MGKFVDPELECLKTEDCELSSKIASIEVEVVVKKDDEIKKELYKELSDLKKKQGKIRDKKSEIESYINGYVRIEAVIACFIGAVFFCVVKEDDSVFSSAIQFALTMASIVFLSVILCGITCVMSDLMNKVHIRKKSANERRKNSIVTTIKASAIFLAVVYVFMVLIDML